MEDLLIDLAAVRTAEEGEFEITVFRCLRRYTVSCRSALIGLNLHMLLLLFCAYGTRPSAQIAVFLCGKLSTDMKCPASFHQNGYD